MLAVAAGGSRPARAVAAHRGPPFRPRGPRRPRPLRPGRGAAVGRDRGQASVTPTIPDHGLTSRSQPADVSHDEAAAWLRSVRAGAVLLLATDAPDPLTAGPGAALRLPRRGPPDRRRRCARSRGLRRPVRRRDATFATVPRRAARADRHAQRRRRWWSCPVGKGSVWVALAAAAADQPRRRSLGAAVALPLAVARRRHGRLSTRSTRAARRRSARSPTCRLGQLVILEAAVIAVLPPLRRAPPRAGGAGGAEAGRSTVELCARWRRCTARRDGSARSPGRWPAPTARTSAGSPGRPSRRCTSSSPPRRPAPPCEHALGSRRSRGG